MAINFVKNDDIRILRDIEQYYGTQIDEMPMNGACRACVRPCVLGLDALALPVLLLLIRSLSCAVADLI